MGDRYINRRIIKDIDFIDREEIIDCVKQEYLKSIHEPGYFKLISIYGIGGIGKSSLLQEINSVLDTVKVGTAKIFITYELDKTLDLLNALILLRKKVDHSCILFDYAVLSLWEKYRVEKFDDEYLKCIKSNLITLMMRIGDNFLPYSPGLSNIIELINLCVQKIKDNFPKARQALDDILSMSNESPEDLCRMLPNLLAQDLNKIYSDNKLVLMIDAYVETTSMETLNWLNELIAALKNGLVLVTSRERLNLSAAKNHLIIYELKSLPRKSARDFLNKHIEEKHSYLVESLMEKTKCIPLYLTMAVQIYLDTKERADFNADDLITIDNKEDLIRLFFDHLSKDYQNILLILCVIHIYDEQILKFLTEQMRFACNEFDLERINSVSMVSYIENSEGLRKLHDAISVNVCHSLEHSLRKKIFDYYITYISTRGTYAFSRTQKLILFSNILDLIDMNDFHLDLEEKEKIEDIFLGFFEDISVPEIDQIINKVSAKSLEDIKLLIEIMRYRQTSATKCIRAFDTYSQHGYDYGKHNKSVRAVYDYSLCIRGEYARAAESLKKSYRALSSNEYSNWYYGKIKIYYADVLFLQGDFIQGLDIFKSYENELQNDDLKKADLFEARKQAGHIYRFNFMLDQAASCYKSLSYDSQYTMVMRAYMLTCICEVNCYFNPGITLSNYEDALKSSSELAQKANLSKIYYAAGIAHLVLNHPDQAKDCIDKSFEINKQHNYPSGELFTLQAQMYCEYSSLGKISLQTLAAFKTKLKQVEVYGFLMLPVYVMQNDKQSIKRIKTKYRWINFSHSLKEIRRFLYSIQRQGRRPL